MVDSNQQEENLESLMEMSQDGDEKAYAKLLGLIAPMIKGYLVNHMSGSSDVEDVLQEVLISVHNARHTYDSSRAFKPWMFSIAKFRLYDYLRGRYRKSRNDEIFMNELKEESFDDVTEDGFDSELLHMAIDKLPEKQKKIIKLLKFEGYTAKEVAKQMKMTESAVKVSAHRSYKKLKEILESEE